MPKKTREGGKGTVQMNDDNPTESSESSSSLSSSAVSDNGDGLLAPASCRESDTKLTVDSSNDNGVVKKVKARPKAEKGASDHAGTDDWMHPIEKDGDLVLEVECGTKQAHLYLSKLCQGSKGSCIIYDGSWLTPNEFQFICGRESAKDWKRSIRHREKSLKLLVAKGIITIHPKSCDCDGCRVSKKVNKCRLADKRRESFGEGVGQSSANAVAAVAAAATTAAAARFTPCKDGRGVVGSESDENTLDNVDGQTHQHKQDVTKDDSIASLAQDANATDDHLLLTSLTSEPRFISKIPNGVDVDGGDAQNSDMVLGESPDKDRNGNPEKVGHCDPAPDKHVSEACVYPHTETSEVTDETRNQDAVPMNDADKDRDEVCEAGKHGMIVQTAGGEGNSPKKEAQVAEPTSRAKQNVPEMVGTEPTLISPRLEQRDQPEPLLNSTGYLKDNTEHPEDQAGQHFGQSEMEEPVVNVASLPIADTCQPSHVHKDRTDQQPDLGISPDDKQLTDLNENSKNQDFPQDTHYSSKASHVAPHEETVGRCTSFREDKHIHLENGDQSISPPEDIVSNGQASTSPLNKQEATRTGDDNIAEDTATRRHPPTLKEKAILEHVNIRDASCNPQQEEKHQHKKKDDDIGGHPEKHQSITDHPQKQQDVTADNDHHRQQSRSIDAHTTHHKHSNHSSHHHNHRKDHDRHSRDSSKQTVATVRPQKVEPVTSVHSSLNKTIPGPNIGSTYPHYSPLPYPTHGQMPLGISWPFPIASGLSEQLHLSSRPTSSTEYMRLLAASHYHNMNSSSLTPDLPGTLPHYGINSRLHPSLSYTYPGMPFYPPHLAIKDMHSYLPAMASAPTLPPSFMASPLSPHLPPMFGTLPSAPILDYAKLHNLSVAATTRSSEASVNNATIHSSSSRDAESQNRKRKSTDGHEPEPALDLSTIKKYKAGEYHGKSDSEPGDQQSPLSTTRHHGVYQEHKIKLLQSFTGHQDPSSSLIESANRSRLRCSTECTCGRVRPITEWTVEEVCDFLRALEGCFPYAERFREQGVDGRILSILTLDQLTHILGMKLGPAVLLTETVVKFLHSAARQGCERCTGSSTSSVSNAPTFAQVRRPEGILIHAS